MLALLHIQSLKLLRHPSPSHICRSMCTPFLESGQSFHNSMHLIHFNTLYFPVTLTLWMHLIHHIHQNITPLTTYKFTSENRKNFLTKNDVFGCGWMSIPCLTLVPRLFCLVESCSQDAAANACMLSVYLTASLYFHRQLFICMERDLVSIHRVSLLDPLATINLY